MQMTNPDAYQTEREFLEAIMARSNDPDLIIAIDELDHADRIEIRVKLQAAGCDIMPRNLWYDYATQTWIDAESALI